VSSRYPTFFVNGQPLGAEDLHTRVKRLILQAPAAPQPAPADRPPGALPQRDGAISRAPGLEREMPEALQ
jgi:hypothetical protein